MCVAFPRHRHGRQASIGASSGGGGQYRRALQETGTASTLVDMDLPHEAGIDMAIPGAREVRHGE